MNKKEKTAEPKSAIIKLEGLVPFKNHPYKVIKTKDRIDRKHQQTRNFESAARSSA